MADTSDTPSGDGRIVRLADGPSRGRRGLPQKQRSTVDRSDVDLTERGLPGTRILAGQIFEDPLLELQGLQGLYKLQRMSYDPTVAALLRSVELPIRSARWIVEPASEDPRHVEIADFVHWTLWEFGTQSFDDIIRAALGMNWAGFSFSEIIYDIVSEGEFTNFVGWDKLAYRHPFSKWRWNVEEVDTPSGGRIRRLVSVTQLAPPNYIETVIPKEKFLLWVHDMLGENFDGIPMIRQAYKAWFYKDLLQKIQAIGLERAYMGIPHVSYPEDFTAKERDAARVIGENLRTSENAAIVAPEHIGVTILGNKVEGTSMQQAINFYDTATLMSCLAQFVQLGTKGVGSYGLSEDQSELFLMAINSVANYSGEVFNLIPGIPQLVRFNYGGVTASDMPRLSHGIVGQGRSLDKLARGMGVLAQWGILTPDDSLEDWVREQLEAPQRDNAITDEALANLIDTVAGAPTMPITHQGPRFPIPGTAAGLGVTITTPGGPGGLANPKTPPAADGTPGGAPAAGGAAPAPGQPTRADFDEAWVRRRWPRPTGRLTATDRGRIRATEAFFSALSDVRSDLGRKPERPSIRLAKARRPYEVLRMAEAPADVVRRVDREARTGGLRSAPGPREQIVTPPHQTIAERYVDQLSTFIGGLGAPRE
jgi:hypothetical protein